MAALYLRSNSGALGSKPGAWEGQGGGSAFLMVYLMTRYERGPSQSGYPKGALGPVVGLRARSTGGVWRTGLLLGVWSSSDLYRSPLSAVLLQPHMSHRRGQGQRPSEEGRGPWPWAL